MSHPDPLYDPDNSHEDDDMIDREEIFEMDGVECGREDGFEDNSNYDDHDDFYGESADYSDYNDDRDYDDSMDGDHDSAMTSCGWGTDEDYGYYDDREDFHSDDGCGYYDDGE